MPRAAASVVGALIVVSLMAGCAAPFVPAREAAVAVPATSLCDPAIAAGGLPDGFEPVAVYTCDAAYELDPPTTVDGDVLEAELPPPERREGDLAALLAAFAAPNDPRWPGACPAIGWAGPSIWAVDARERLVRLQYPVDGCGLPRADAVFAALDALAMAP